MLFLSVLVYVGAIVTNIVMDRKKGNSMITSIVGLTGLVFSLIYVIGWWVGDTTKGLRDAKDAEAFGVKVKLNGAFKFGRILYWFVLFVGMPVGVLPAVMGGFIGKDKI